MEKITIKQGATLSLTGLVSLPAGTWSATSNIETPDGVLIATMETDLQQLSSPDSSGNTHSILLVCSAEKTNNFEVGIGWLAGKF